MTLASTSCQQVPADIQKANLPLLHGAQVSAVFEHKERITAVDKVDFHIHQGIITAIIGESGSGKSTLLKLIYGLLEPSTGEVRYRGWLVPTRKDKLIPGHEAMKLVSQGFDDLNLYAKVWDNVASQLSNTNITLKNSKTQAILEKLRIDHLANQRISDLSGGEKQRVAIARALINEPEVLLMDEPFNQVDASFRDLLQQDIRHIVDQTGLTVLLVSHDPAEVLALADDLIVMKNARILEQGNPTALYHHPQHPYTALLLAKSNILNATQSAVLGLPSSHTLAIHQEHILVTAAAESIYSILEIRFRGFYHELIVGNADIRLHAIHVPPLPLLQGTKVHIAISHYTSFSAAL